MIRNRLRLIGNFLLNIKKSNKDITDFASVYHPAFFEDAKKAVRICANYDQDEKVYKTLYNGTALGMSLRKCSLVAKARCVKKSLVAEKKAIKDFMTLFEDDFPTITKQVLEDQSKTRREKKIVLPKKEGFKKLYVHVKQICEDAMAKLQDKFNLSAWKRLGEASLIFVQLFNRRRTGEMERLLLDSYENHQTLDDALDSELYQSNSADPRRQAKQFVRLMIRGKLGRTVPVLLHKFLVDYEETLITYRKSAKVAPTNKYVFAVAHVTKERKEYLRACPLMR